MFELVVMFVRYLFIFYVLYFMWQSFVFITGERGMYLGNWRLSLSKQRVTIVFFHVTAFLILSYRPNKYLFDTALLLTGTAVLVLFILVRVAVSRLFKNSCHLIWNCVFFLLDVGIIMLQRLNPILARRQLIWCFLGVLSLLFIPLLFKLLPKIQKFYNLYIVFCVMLLSAPFLIGVEEYGAINWISIGAISFQPSEIAKLLFVFYLASVFKDVLSLKMIIVQIAVAATIVLILVIQKDLGGALIFFMSFMTTLYIGLGSKLLFIGGILSASMAAFLAYRVFPHVRIRVEAWINPWNDIDVGGYQITQSLFAIATWGFLGSGLTRGIPEKIPVVEKDFIFSAICEEFGGLFGICLIAIFIILFYRGVIIAINCHERFFSLLAVGIINMMAFQTFLIIGGVIKLIPLTGVTLPFVSYGGTSIVVSFLSIGVLQYTKSTIPLMEA